MSRIERRLTFIITLITVALAGLLIVQVVLLRNAWEQKEQVFRQNVLAAMNNVAQKLEARETTKSALEAIPPSQRNQTRAMVSIFATTDINDTSSGVFSFDHLVDSSTPFRVTDSALFYAVPTKLHVVIEALDTLRNERRVLVDTVKNPGQYEYAYGYDDSITSHEIFLFQFSNDSSKMTYSTSPRTQMGSWHTMLPNTKQTMIDKVVERLVLGEFKPFEERVSDTLLDSLIAASLQESGIDLDYQYAVIHQPDSLSYIHPANARDELIQSEFRTALFSHNLLSPRYDLTLNFPGQTTFLLGQIGPLLGATTLFMLIIALSFAYSIRTIVRQRQFARRTSDFINNMTHEFKTPISTIALAAEAIVKPELSQERKGVERFGKMIQEENKRMSHQVEKILQMATLEERDYDLNITEIDMHELLDKAAESFALRVEEKQGVLRKRFEAARNIISGDPVHIAGVVHNLLDNALKYASDRPEITLSTAEREGMFLLSVQDNGIGIAPKDREMIFEKYYRVSTGNVHDVKGFGIGLSYVKLMTEAHGGRIELRSEIGKGTEIVLLFPYSANPSEGA